MPAVTSSEQNSQFLLPGHRTRPSVSHTHTHTQIRDTVHMGLLSLHGRCLPLSSELWIVSHWLDGVPVWRSGRQSGRVYCGRSSASSGSRLLVPLTFRPIFHVVGTKVKNHDSQFFLFLILNWNSMQKPAKILIQGTRLHCISRQKRHYWSVLNK